jgi:hypothetical protein
MKFNWSIFAHLAQAIAPIVIYTINPKLAALATSIGNGIAEAESIPDAKGPDKLKHVLNIVDNAAAGINASAGKDVIDSEGLHAAATEVINTTIDVVNTVGNKAAKVNKVPPSE